MTDTAFQPVAQHRARLDGWTPEKQVAFIEALSETASVTDACARVGMSRDSAYRLRNREGGQGFDRAWRLALATAANVLTDTAFERALNGVALPVFHRGEQVGERRRYDNRLLYSVLRAYDAPRYDPERIVRYRQQAERRAGQLLEESPFGREERREREYTVDDLVPDPVKPEDRLAFLQMELAEIERGDDKNVCENDANA